jgi:iron(III) transport system permease protein
VDPRTWPLVLNTLLLAGPTCAVSLPVGAFLAWCLIRTDLPGRRFGLIGVGLMLFVPLYVQAAAWQAGFGAEGWSTVSWSMPTWLHRWPGAIWVHALAAVPWVTLIVGAGLLWGEPELEEQALLDGSPRQVFFRVTLPGTLGAISAAALWTAVVAAGEMTVTDLFVIRTYAEEVYTQSAGGSANDGPSLGMVPGILITALLVAGSLLLTARLTSRNRPLTLRRAWICPVRRGRLGLTLAAGALLLVLIGIPLGSLIYKAGVLVEQSGDVRGRTWSAVKCLAMVAAAPWKFRREMGWSLLIGASAATAAVALAVPLAWWARRGGLRLLPALLAAALSFAIPGPTLGLVVIWLLDRPGIPGLVWLYDRSILAPWLALTVRCLAPALLVLWHALRSVPQALLESAAVDGAGPIRQLAWIVLPLRWRAVLLAWLVALAVALADLAASILVVPPGVQTLSICVFRLLHYGADDQVAGICLAQIVAFGLIACAVARLAGQVRDSRYNGNGK